jgi:hypothetical protein
VAVGSLPAGIPLQPGVVFNPNGKGGMPKPAVGRPYSFSFCSGEVITVGAAPECTPGTANPEMVSPGLAASYVFRVAPGQFLPRGLTLDSYTGVLYGKADESWPVGGVRICAQQLNDTAACSSPSLIAPSPQATQWENRLSRLTNADVRATGGEPAAAGGSAPRRMGNTGKIVTILGLAAAGGVAAALIHKQMLKNQGGECGPSPAASLAACYDGVNRPSDCNQRQDRMAAWCECTGGVYDRFAGICS